MMRFFDKCISFGIVTSTWPISFWVSIFKDYLTFLFAQYFLKYTIATAIGPEFYWLEKISRTFASIYWSSDNKLVTWNKKILEKVKHNNEGISDTAHIFLSEYTFWLTIPYVQIQMIYFIDVTTIWNANYKFILYICNICLCIYKHTKIMFCK